MATTDEEKKTGNEALLTQRMRSATKEVHDQSDRCMPFFFLDGHISRVGLPFLKYVNDIRHPWCECIGVPYSTNMWQVVDNKKQNGVLNMSL